MNDTVNNEWIARQEGSPELRREYEYERLVVDALERIHEAMDRSGVTKADLARTLQTSRSHITQVLAGDRNITLRTLSDLAFASGARLCFKGEPLRSGAFVSSPAMIVETKKRVVIRQLLTRIDSHQEPLDVGLCGCAP